MTIKKIIAIASAKGGVGKSSITAMSALSLADTYKVGILDADIYGPNQHLLFGFEDHKHEIVETPSQKLLKPLVVNNIKIASMGPILNNNKAAIWRGPMLSNAIKQLIHKTEWGELDILFVDMPPGTGDAYITIANELNIDGVIFISTNNKLSIHDTIKSINTCKKLKIPIIGAIQNSTYPHNNDEKLVLSHQIQQITSIDFNEKIYNMNFNNTFLESLNLKEIYENIIHG